MQPISSETISNQTIQQEQIPIQADMPEDSSPKTKVDQPEGEIKEDPNWRAFREARKKDRIEKEAAEKKAAEKEAEVAALKAAMEAAFSTRNVVPNHQQVDYGNYGQEETEDERIQKKIDAALAAREEQYRRESAQREAQEYPQRLQSTYSDYSQVVSQENLDYLDYHYPEVSGPLSRLPNDYAKWSDIYKAVKKFVPNHANAKKDSARAEANFNKPKSMSSMGTTQSPTQQNSNILTDQQKQQNWERMQRLLKGVS